MDDGCVKIVIPSSDEALSTVTVIIRSPTGRHVWTMRFCYYPRSLEVCVCLSVCMYMCIFRFICFYVVYLSIWYLLVHRYACDVCACSSICVLSVYPTLSVV